MAYIGKQPVVGNFVKLDTITTSATATYNLLNGGVSYFPQTANNCIVSLNGVIQSPTSAYTISGSTIVFSDALTSSDTIDFILVLGDVLSIGTPSDGTITSAKLASGTDGLFAWQSVQTTGFTAVAAAMPANTYWGTFASPRADVGPESEDPSYIRDPRYFNGYANVSRIGASYDFCRMISTTEDPKNKFFACALAGTENLSSTKFRTADTAHGFKISDDDYMRDINDIHAPFFKNIFI